MRTGRALLVVLCLTATACGGIKIPDEPTAANRGTIASATTVLPAARSGSTATQPAGTTAPATAPTTVRTVQPAPTRSAGTRAPATTVSSADIAIRQAAIGSPGDAAGIILQPAPAASLVVEVMEEPGVGANRIALDRVLSDLRRYSGKTVTEVHTSLPSGSSSRKWTEAQLNNLADRSSRFTQGSGRFVMRMIFVLGQNSASSSILAESFRGDTIAAFPERYASAGQQVITAVTVHEIGHLMGLVDLYLNRGRADTQNDPAGGGHSSNRASVMYWAVDSSVLGTLFGSVSDRFDADDERDLAAIHAGATYGSNPR